MVECADCGWTGEDWECVVYDSSSEGDVVPTPQCPKCDSVNLIRIDDTYAHLNPYPC